MNENFLDVGKRIKFALDKKGLKQIDACKKTAISKNAISNYINGNRIPDTHSLYKLSILLDVSMEWLLTGCEPQIRSNETSIPDSISDQLANFISVNLNLKVEYLKLLQKYHLLSADDKEEITAIINIKYARLSKKNNVINNIYR